MAPRVPELSTCCFYFSLKAGAKFFGFFTLVVNSFIFLVVSTIIIHYFFTARHKQEPDDEFTEFVLSSILDIVVCVAQMVTSVLLLLGVYQDKRHLLRPWLVSNAVAAFCELFFLTSPLTTVVFGRPESNFPWFFFNSILLVDDIYGWLVVYSYYRVLNPQEV